MRLTKLRTMSLGPGPGSSTAISSTAVLSTLVCLILFRLCNNAKIIHLLAYPITKSC